MERESHRPRRSAKTRRRAHPQPLTRTPSPPYRWTSSQPSEASLPEFVERLKAALADRYRIERELGAGGMATVYLAHDLKHDRDVAIKLLHPDLGAALGADRFLTEIRTTARLQHLHILPLLDSDGADGLLYYVMPHVTGRRSARGWNGSGNCRSRTRSGSRARWPTHWAPPTSSASSIATSSRRTSCCKATTLSWPTSASRWRCRVPADNG